jgi:hypothetical protein
MTTPKMEPPCRPNILVERLIQSAEQTVHLMLARWAIRVIKERRRPIPKQDASEAHST